MAILAIGYFLYMFYIIFSLLIYFTDCLACILGLNWLYYYSLVHSPGPCRGRLFPALTCVVSLQMLGTTSKIICPDPRRRNLQEDLH